MEVVEQMFTLVHQTLLQSQTFLKHHSISSAGGFNILLNGIRVLKVSDLCLALILRFKLHIKLKKSDHR